MVPVPAVTFEMGDPWNEWDADELPVHSVTLSAYEVGKYEVTNQEYADVLNWANSRGYLTTASSRTVTAYGQELLDVYAGGCQIGYSGGPFVVESRDGYSMADHPVGDVTWYGAVAFCNWLSESHELQPCYDTDTWTCDFSKDGYHLPTEAQWERAAAWDGSIHRRYGNGSDNISCSNANYYNGSEYCNPMGFSSMPYTSPVGHYDGAPSPVGCYDMSGNVWEWCNDWVKREYTSNPVTGPEGPSSGSTRVFRGGSWGSRGNSCRSAIRSGSYPWWPYSTVGFRLARSSP